MLVVALIMVIVASVVILLLIVFVKKRRASKPKQTKSADGVEMGSQASKPTGMALESDAEATPKDTGEEGKTMNVWRGYQLQ